MCYFFGHFFWKTCNNATLAYAFRESLNVHGQVSDGDK